MFSTKRHNAEFEAITALLYIFRQSMAELNGRTYHESAACKHLIASNQRQIEANKADRELALHWKMSDEFAMQQMLKRRSEARG